VHHIVGLLADLAVDPRAMNDGVAPGESRVQIAPATERHDLVAIRPKPLGDMPADEPGASGDGDPHYVHRKFPRRHSQDAGIANPGTLRAPCVAAVALIELNGTRGGQCASAGRAVIVERMVGASSEGGSVLLFASKL
jgi:hypothetical protein